MIRVCTYNIHKGLSLFNRRIVLDEIRGYLSALAIDIVFLQEVQGLKLKGRFKIEDVKQAQYNILAQDVWSDMAYGKNAVYADGHHGNAILSRFNIIESHNLDVSDHRFEQRGILHCVLSIPDIELPVHCFCVHLGLFGHSRRRQMKKLIWLVDTVAKNHEPVIIAGDFNDWRNDARKILIEQLQLVEAHTNEHGKLARSFPSHLPLLQLDRIYVRGFRVEQAQVYKGLNWSKISDHVPLTADLLEINRDQA